MPKEFLETVDANSDCTFRIERGSDHSFAVQIDWRPAGSSQWNQIFIGKIANGPEYALGVTLYKQPTKCDVRFSVQYEKGGQFHDAALSNTAVMGDVKRLWFVDDNVRDDDFDLQILIVPIKG